MNESQQALPVRDNETQEQNLKSRLAVVGIVMEDPANTGPRVNMILSQFEDVLVARTGVTVKERGAGVISLIVDANNNQLGALTGKLGMVRQVRVRSVML